MHTLSINKKQVAHAIGAMMLSLGATQAFATGFQLNENSASGLGNAFAAGAAFTDDVSAMWWNPAALSQFPRDAGRGGAAHHHAVDQVQQQRVGAGRQPAARQRRRRRGRLQLRAEHVPVRADQRSSGRSASASTPRSA